MTQIVRKQLVALGVNGIITNKPQFIRENLGLGRL